MNQLRRCSCSEEESLTEGVEQGDQPPRFVLRAQRENGDVVDDDGVLSRGGQSHATDSERAVLTKALPIEM